MLHLFHQLSLLALFHNQQFAIGNFQLCPRREEPRKNDPSRTGGDIDKSAAASRHMRAMAEFGDIDAAILVNFQKRQQRGIKPAALKIGELRW